MYWTGSPSLLFTYFVFGYLLIMVFYDNQGNSKRLWTLYKRNGIEHYLCSQKSLTIHHLSFQSPFIAPPDMLFSLVTLLVGPKCVLAVSKKHVTDTYGSTLPVFNDYFNLRSLRLISTGDTSVGNLKHSSPAQLSPFTAMSLYRTACYPVISCCSTVGCWKEWRVLALWNKWQIIT